MNENIPAHPELKRRIQLTASEINWLRTRIESSVDNTVQDKICYNSVSKKLLAAMLELNLITLQSGTDTATISSTPIPAKEIKQYGDNRATELQAKVDRGGLLSEAENAELMELMGF